MNKISKPKSVGASVIYMADGRKQKRAKYRIWQDVAVGFITLSFVMYGVWNHVASHAKSLHCKKAGVVQVVNLQDEVFTPNYIQLQLCDTLRIINTGHEEYVLAFGIHERHVEYPGFSMQSLQPNEYLEVDTIQTGQFTMHDHLRNKARLFLDINF